MSNDSVNTLTMVVVHLLVSWIIADVLLRFEERVYRVSESIGEFEVCVSVEGAMMELVSLTVRSQNGSASGRNTKINIREDQIYINHTPVNHK